MQNHPGRRTRFPSRPEGSNPNVTSAIGLEETAGIVRARRNSLFTRTAIWVTALICLALLLGALAQAWSNNQLTQQVLSAQQQYQQAQAQNQYLQTQVTHYKDPFVIESEARQQLGYVRPGDHPLVVVGPNTPTTQSAPRPNKTPTQSNFWQEWWNVFFGA